MTPAGSKSLSEKLREKIYTFKWDWHLEEELDPIIDELLSAVDALERYKHLSIPKERGLTNDSSQFFPFAQVALERLEKLVGK